VALDFVQSAQSQAPETGPVKLSNILGKLIVGVAIIIVVTFLIYQTR
jgi:capsular polysaccharide biosynthesis protein